MFATSHYHRYRLYTLPHEPESSCLSNHRDLLPIRESANKAVLHAAKSVIRLSSSLDGKPLANCCGLWIKWDAESKTGIVLTTAQLIRSNNSKHSTYTIANHWEEGADQYHIKANVIVHLLDDTTVQGHYLYHQEHYDLAFFEVRVDEPVDLPSFSSSVHSGLDVFRLARDVHMNLRITHGWVEDRNPGSNERHHSMYFSHQKTDYHPRKDFNNCVYHVKKEDYPCNEDGGSIIDLDGKVVGLFNKHPTKSFVPSYILDKCLDLWLEFRDCFHAWHVHFHLD
nr:uncharacterized protein LOC127303283 [Lolium perenne]